MNKKLLEVTQGNERAANSAIGVLFGLGLALSAAGAYSWYKKVQLRDDQLVQLQMRKLEAEIAKLEADVPCAEDRMSVRAGAAASRRRS